jgi:aminoglycoside/choline kinase family phosphotransferase
MTRTERLHQFINNYISGQPFQLTPITGDASFRRYFRLATNTEQFVVMDSDPQKVNNIPYINLNDVFSRQGFLLPSIISSDESQGFFILSDLGAIHLADLLNDKSRELYYQQLIQLSALWAKTPPSPAMLPYDKAFIESEMGIFNQWLVCDYLQLTLSAEQQILWQKATTLLTATMQAQPTVTMHRDYHSRNIMRSNEQWAIIDYQDAVQGPLCYDLVSLLRDCYYKLPQHELNRLIRYGYDEFKQQNLISNTSFDEFKYWFDLTGLQRHIKAAGIFCRLYLRDEKAGYLDNILPTMEYIIDVAAQYSQLRALSEWMKNTINPALVEKLKKDLQ